MKRVFLISSIITTFIIMVGFTTRNIRKKNTEISTMNKLTNYNAKSIIAMDMDTKEIVYEYNAYNQMLPASITKILTCYTAIKTYSLNDYVVITKDMINTVGSKIYLEENDIISIKDLLYGLMLQSGNDAAMALALHLTGTLSDFLELMNNYAKLLGMKNSIFNNPTGLDEDSKNYVTAYDMAVLYTEAYKNKVFKEIVSTISYSTTTYSGKKMYFHNKHRLVSNKEASGGKTGYTKLAKRTLVTSFTKENHNIVIVTLSASDDWNIHRSISDKYFCELLNIKNNQVLSNRVINYPYFLISNALRRVYNE